MATRGGQTTQDNQAQETVSNGADDQGLSQGSQENLQNQLSEAMQPVISNLQAQIGQTVQDLFQQTGAGAESDQSGTESGSGETSASDTAQTLWQSVEQTIRSIWEWIVEMVRRFGDQVAEAVGNLVGLLVQRAIKSAF